VVRVVNKAVEQIDVNALLAQYKGGGTSSYHPKMLLKVLVYAYARRIYSSRRIAEALRENIHFMWISWENCPDFRTINDFRGKRMKAVIGDVFSQVMEYLAAGGQVKLENYFLDGTKIEADASCMRMKEDRGAEKPWSKPAYNCRSEPKASLSWGSACMDGQATQPV